MLVKDRREELEKLAVRRDPDHARCGQVAARVKAIGVEG
jgi:hypothetical protein